MPKSQSIKGKDGKWRFSGYSFDEDSIANQMAFLFAGEEGIKRAKAIREAAEKLPESERQQYIEQEVRKKGTEVDQGFKGGLVDIIEKLPKSGEDLSGPAAGKDLAVSLMKGLGLNVDPNNVQTHYSPGPPLCFQISWVNKPTQELKYPDSEINQLSKCYAESLSTNPKAQEDFNTRWSQHVTNAMNDGPKIDKTKFEMDAAKSWSDFKGSAKKEHEQSMKSTATDDLEQDTSNQNQPR